MKQSTRGNNFAHLIRQELVKRFEGVVLNEIEKNNRIVSVFDKQVKDLSDELHFIKGQLKALIDGVDETKSQLSEQYINEKKQLVSQYKTQFKWLSDKAEETDKKAYEMMKSLGHFVNYTKYEEDVNRIEDFMNKINHAFCDLRNEMLETLHEHKNALFSEVNAVVSVLQKEFGKVLKKLEESDKKLDEYTNESQGFRREMQVIKKTVFINEKHIEYLVNLQTKRGE